MRPNLTQFFTPKTIITNLRNLSAQLTVSRTSCKFLFYFINLVNGDQIPPPPRNIQYLYFFVIRLSLIATCDIHRWVAGADLGLGVVDIHSDHRAHVARLHLCEQDHCRPLVGPAHTPTLQNEEICQSNGHGFESHVFYSELWGAQGFTVQYVKERKNFFFYNYKSIYFYYEDCVYLICWHSYRLQTCWIFKSHATP